MRPPSSNGRGLECGRCGTGLPHTANYCVRCGERIEPEAVQDAPAAADDECTVVWWRGYVEAGFFAVPVDGSAQSTEPLGSSLFRRLGGGAPVPEGRVLEAHRVLVERMQREGWEQAGRGARWYETRFRRTPGFEPAEDAAVDPSPRRSLTAPAPPPPPPARHGVPADDESSAGTATGRGLGRRLGLSPQAARAKT